MDQTHFRMNNGILRGFFNITRTNNCGRNFLSRNDIPKLSHEKKKKKKLCEEDLTEKDLINSPGSNELTKEFCETF